MSLPLLDDRYLLLDQIGRGGMATVYRAFDRVDQGIVAIKLQTTPAPAGPAHPLSAEFEAWTRLRHPNIARAIDLRVARRWRRFRGAPYLVLEHARGRPANQALRPGTVSSIVVECFAIQVLRALRHVHAAGLIHRDVKPSNLITEMDGDRLKRVKLIDFGLASPGGRCAEPGQLSGSLPYVAPEALLGLPVDGRADLYGLGIALHFLFTGRLPARSRTVEELLRWHLSTEPADPAASRPSVSNRLRQLILRVTQRDPARRPATADDALLLLGVEPGRRTAVGEASKGRAPRASLRLALDAVRLGARRRFVLPASPRLAKELLREARVWSRIRGIEFHHLRTGLRDGRRSLAHMVLRLLLDQGERAIRLARRHGLECWVSPGILPTWAVESHPAPWSGDSPRQALLRRRRGAALSRFLLACATERPLVVSLDRAANRDPLASIVANRLRLATENSAGPRPGRGGLLLLDRTPGRPRATGAGSLSPASARGSSAPG